MDLYEKGRRFTARVSEQEWQLWFEGKFVAGGNTETKYKKLCRELKAENIQAAKKAAKKLADNNFEFKAKIKPVN